MKRFMLPATFVLAVLLTVIAPANAVTYIATVLHPPGYFETSGIGISATSKVGWGSPVPLGGLHHAVIWNGAANSVIDLNPAGNIWSEAFAAWGNSQVGGASTTGAFAYQYHATLWHGTAASAVDLHPQDFSYSQANGVFGDIQVGSGTFEGEDHALLWHGTAASVVDLAPSGFFYSSAYATSDTNQVGAANIVTGRTHAMLWSGTAASAVDLNPSKFPESRALGVSGSSQVGYGFGQGTTSHALLWHGTAASAIDLHPAGFFDSVATGVFGATQVGYGYSSAANSSHALLWNGTPASALDLHQFLSNLSPAFHTSQAFGISENGDIIGSALFYNDLTGNNDMYAIHWSPVPEPASCALITGAFFVAFLLRGRRRLA